MQLAQHAYDIRGTFCRSNEVLREKLSLDFMKPPSLSHTCCENWQNLSSPGARATWQTLQRRPVEEATAAEASAAEEPATAAFAEVTVSLNVQK